MEKEKKVEAKPKRKRNILLFFGLMVILMLIYDVVTNEIYPIISRMLLYGKYGQNAIIEAVCALLILIVLLLFKNSYIFTEKKNGFIKSLMVGGYITVYATLLLLTSIVEIKGSIDILDVGSLALFCLLIGIYEEFLCRGWIQNEFIERFASTRKEVILSIFLSALIFGGIHISNIWIGGQTVIETMSQIVQAVGMGFLLGAIYYRTKNIWSVIFLHGYWDFSLFISEINIIKTCTEGPTTLEYKIISLIASTIIATASIVIGLYVLRKHKTQGYIEGESLTEEEVKKSKKSSKFYVLGAIALYSGFIFLPVADGNETCYEYNNKHIAYDEIISPVYTEYTIKELDIRISLTEDNKVLFHNLKTNQKEYFSKNYISDFLIVKDNNTYKIMLLGLNDFQNDTVVYYSEFIDVSNYQESKEYLTEIIKSFKLLSDAPTTTDLKYLVSLNNKIYLVIETSNEEQLVLIEDKFHILVHQENTEEKEESIPDTLPGNNNEVPQEETPEVEEHPSYNMENNVPEKQEA